MVRVIYEGDTDQHRLLLADGTDLTQKCAVASYTVRAAAKSGPKEPQPLPVVSIELYIWRVQMDAGVMWKWRGGERPEDFRNVRRLEFEDGEVVEFENFIEGTGDETW